MAGFDFQIFCCGVDTRDETFLDRLYEAGCGDATVFFGDDCVCLDFTREAEDAEGAIVSAIKDVDRCVDYVDCVGVFD